jgi:putrescine aminotransferase
MTVAQIDEMVERIRVCLDLTLTDVQRRGWLD